MAGQQALNLRIGVRVPAHQSLEVPWGIRFKCCIISSLTIRAYVAQPEEQRTCNALVGGSTPPVGSKYCVVAL